MIIDERLRTYIHSLDKGNTPFLEELENQAHQDGVPIIRAEMQTLIKTLLALKRPERILEVGTAVGFSALLISEYAGPDARIVTIENFEKRIPEARGNFKKAGREGQITLLEGDAGDILPSLSGPYDFIFMDAAKGQYINWLADLVRLLLPGGILLSDNVLQEGDLTESHFLVERRNRTIHKRMREYLFALTHHEQLCTVILPVGDGAALSVKVENRCQETIS